MSNAIKGSKGKFCKHNISLSEECSKCELETVNGKIPGRKDDGKKLRWTLLPLLEIEEVVKVLEFGAVKYQVDNWKKVDDGEMRYLNAAYRHLAEIGKKQATDEETGFSHYAHAICSLLFACWHSKWGKKSNG